MEHEICSNHFTLLDQGYVPGIFGVSHGALQFMAYEKLKKGYSQYFGTPINKKLMNTVRAPPKGSNGHQKNARESLQYV